MSNIEKLEKVIDELKIYSIACAGYAAFNNVLELQKGFYALESALNDLHNLLYDVYENMDIDGITSDIDDGITSDIDTSELKDIIHKMIDNISDKGIMIKVYTFIKYI